MPTVNKQIADDIIAGKYDDDPPVRKIVKYENAWGSEAYGVIYWHQDPNTYAASEYVQNPTTYWQKEQTNETRIT